MKLKRILSLLASLAMAVTALTGAMTVSVVSAADEYATSGTWGSDGKWVLSEDGTLTVTGTGELGDYALTPKFKFVQDVKRLVVGEGITKISNAFTGSGDLQHANVTEMVLPSTLSTLSGRFDFSIKGNAVKDVYIYSKNITETDSYLLPNPGRGIVMHLYKDSFTEKNFRSFYDYTDEDIVYIEGDRPEEPEPVPAKVASLTESSGPSGLSSKWEWNETSKTLTFSGKGTISIANEYKKYAETTEHIVIEKGITVIDDRADTHLSDNTDYSGSFVGFTALKDVQLPDTIQEIGKCAFCNTPLEEIIFPDSLNIIGEAVFYGTKIKSINLHEGMTIGGKAFSGCNSLKNVKIPNNVYFKNSVGNAAGMYRPPATFSNCTELETVTIENGCAIYDAFGHKIYDDGIVENLFGDCTSLKTVIMKGDFDFMHNKVFYNCTSLTDIYMYNTGLTTITAKGTNLAAAGSPANYNDSFDTSNNPTFHVIKGSQTEQTLKEAGYLTKENTVYIADTTALETAISEAEAIDTSNYTDESVAKFTEALENAKATLENYDATQDEVDSAVKAINKAKNALEEKKEEPSTPSDSSDPTSPSNPTSPTNPTGGNVKKTTSPAQRASEAKATAEKAIKQAKIVSLTAKAKGKKKITVSWKKVAKAAGYEVQASIKKNFKKNVINKATTKNKIVIKKLKSKKKYFVRVRAYATYKDAKGKTQKVYSKWVKSKKKVKVK